MTCILSYCVRALGLLCAALHLFHCFLHEVKRKKPSLTSCQRPSISCERLRFCSSVSCSICSRPVVCAALHYTPSLQKYSVCSDLTDSAVACSHSQRSSLRLAARTHSRSLAPISRRVNKLTPPLGSVLPMS